VITKVKNQVFKIFQSHKQTNRLSQIFNQEETALFKKNIKWFKEEPLK